MRCGGTAGVASSLSKRTVRRVRLASLASMVLLQVLSQVNAGLLLESVRLQQRLQTGMNRVLQATAGRVCTASPAALKWLKREQFAKLAKITTRQSSCRGSHRVERYERLRFQARPATQRVSARRRSGIAYTHFATVLCGPAARRTSRNDR